jgi:hypothetical protein
VVRLEGKAKHRFNTAQNPSRLTRAVPVNKTQPIVAFTSMQQVKRKQAFDAPACNAGGQAGNPLTV